MSALERVRRARRTLVATAMLASLLWSVAAALGVIATAALIGSFVSLPTRAYAALWPLAAASSLVTAALLAWRWRMARSVEHVALWIEERQPELRYALLTAIDTAAAPEALYPELHERAGTAEIGAIVGRARRRALARALMVTVPLIGLVVLLEPRTLLDDARSELALRLAVPAPEPAPLANRLESMTAVVTPPAYSRLPTETLEEPTGVVALVGSRIAFGGRGPAAGVVAIAEADTLHASEASGDHGAEADHEAIHEAAEEAGRGAGHGERWHIALTMPETPVVVSFHDREHRRLVVLEPRPDSVPSVRLRLPATDTVYRTAPTGPLEVEAQASDDIGLDRGYFEYMVTSGGGEVFETQRVRGGRAVFGNAREAVLRDLIRLDTMGLAPGTVLHIRAVAYDYNDLSGPGRGVSETRTLRVAEVEDSVSVAPIPPIPIDSMWISQRLLNMKTDTLLQERGVLERREYTNRSADYGGTQDEIRLRAMGVISNLEDDGVGGTFETEISAMLREAVDLMYDARVHLGIGEPDLAMPIMIRILEILDEIRLANRYYMRGLIRADAIDVERVRLSGEDPASGERREARGTLEDPRAELAARLERAVALVDAAPNAALDSLTYLRAEALTQAQAAAVPLAEAIALLQGQLQGQPRRQLQGRAFADALTEAFSRARRALEAAPLRIEGPIEWGGIP